MSSWQPSPIEGAATSPAGDDTCKNCGALAPGKFCPECGQSTATKVPSAAEFVHDFLVRYAAPDGHIWQTLSKLFFAPGALTVEYIAGARKRYLRPLQLYLAASVVVFAVAQLYGLNLTLRLLGDHGIHLTRGTPVSGNSERIAKGSACAEQPSAWSITSMPKAAMVGSLCGKPARHGRPNRG